MTQEKCHRKFPFPSDTVRIVTVHDSVVYRDTVIYVHLPGGIVTDSVVIPCPPVPGYQPDTARAETQLAVARAWWDAPRVRLQLIQKDTTITARLDSVIRDAWHWRTEYEKISTTVTKQKIPVIYQLALGGWIGIVVLILLFLAVKFIVRIK